jgi:hypothetical protein
MPMLTFVVTLLDKETKALLTYEVQATGHRPAKKKAIADACIDIGWTDEDGEPPFKFVRLRSKG